ncbi:hypothetical protein [Hymenobacter arizonensis]|uniref:Lipocalin-like domain-containing protein n=1 Tax=Hymenobacter arizonensis TaxID=1227077 RepID=A0A1I5YVB0_HYMAR|nr:hypothetical protein [Hymenobacter arizonensis]SFQ48159.1 hypothetical protein SAMN04515668_2472 [Hymenobacter arizonensis]
MPRLFHPYLLTLLVSGSVLSGCEKESDSLTGLAGTWKLTNRECFCAPTPVPNETVTFTNSEFSFYKAGQLSANGAYIFTEGSTCGGSTLIPVARLTYATPNHSPTDVVVTVAGNTLVLDYGIACDAPRETYKRTNTK